jgi:endonuclease/exonuclease/phosphatase (EEP) superfamily protein YafD
MGRALASAAKTSWLDRLAMIGVAGTAMTVLLGELGRFHWRFELLSHFAVQYAAALAIGFVYFLLRRRMLWLAIAGIALLLPAWRIAPYVAPSMTLAPSGSGLRVMTINVHASNDRYDAVRAEIERLDPDIIFLPENTDRWAAGLRPLQARYPYVIDYSSTSVFSLFLFSRVPLSDSAIFRLPEQDGFPAISARVCRAGVDGTTRCIRLIGIHPPPPLTAAWAAKRNAVFQAIPEVVVASDADRTILLGDFNCTPWSPALRDLVAATGLRDSAYGFGPQPTWFSRWLPLGIKIDHILIGSGITATSHVVGRDVGSDHYPVVADVQF